jgi:hypothetical protein
MIPALRLGNVSVAEDFQVEPPTTSGRTDRNGRFDRANWVICAVAA